MINFKDGNLYMDPVTYARLFILNHVAGYTPETSKERMATGYMGTMGEIPVISTCETL